MNAHQLDADGVITNTIVVDSLGALPRLVDASVGGRIGDRIVNGVVVPKPIVPPTVAEYTASVQAYLDAVALAHGYDNIMSACSYAGAPNQFQAEGIKFLAWRGNVWTQCNTTMAQVKAGALAQPTIAALIGALPAYVP